MTAQFITSDALASHTHGFFTRQGGLSTGIYSGLNTGLGSKDDRDAVLQNRAMVSDAMGIESSDLTTIYQIHSADVVQATSSFGDTPPKADAVVSNTKGLGISILTADCAPILFCDAKAGVVGAAHSGWQGAIKGISSQTVKEMEKLGASAATIRAVVGPCISQKNYEVGEEFLENFLAEDPQHMRFFANGVDGKYQFDLPSFCLHALREAGVGDAQWTGHCTYADADRFYSYRRTTHAGEPDYGRLISVIVA